jgi:hypothetical protein
MEKKKFYQRNWFLWLCLIILPPVGIILLWTCHKDKKTVIKIIISVIFVLWFLLLIFAGGDSSDVDSEKEVTVTGETTTEVPVTEDNSTEKNDTESNGELLEEADSNEVSGNQFVEAVKKATDGYVGENENITDVIYQDNDLRVCVDLSKADPSPITYEELALNRTSTLTDKILELTQYYDLWDTITIDFGNIGYVKNGKDNIVESEYGPYFDIENFNLITDESKSTENSTESSEENSDNKANNSDNLPSEIETVCRLITKNFVQEVVEEDYSMFAFNVESFELDDDENGTIDILYMPSDAGNGATKVNLTISKKDNTYKIEYALLAGLYEVDLDQLPSKYLKYTL